MIKNLGALVAAALAIAGCQEDPKYPGALQGVVELEERDLGFEVGGRLVSLPVDEGSEVEAGAVIASLDDSLQRTIHQTRLHEAKAVAAQVALLEEGPRSEEIRAMRARVDAAVATEKQLAKTLARYRAVAGGPGAMPEAAVDELEARYLGAVAEHRVLAQQLHALREGTRSQELAAAIARASAASAAAELEGERLTRFQLCAPIDGTVVAVMVEAGEIVSPGMPVLTVADTRRPYADLFVPQADMAGVAPGRAAEVHVDALDGPLAAEVEYVDRRTEFTPRFLFSEGERPNLVVRVRVRIDDPNRTLSAGLPAFVYLR